MSASVSLLMAIHCHQPVGNFDFVFEQAFRQSYQPFLDTLERHPGVRLALHYSGSLLDWLMTNQPKFLQRLRRLVRAGQVEMLASGYYEPILPLIPESDRQGQIALMQRTLRRHIGTTASGVWLAERVWEPELPVTLETAGIRYTMLDTNQFRAAKDLLPAASQYQDQDGWDVLGCYVTEYGGSSVTLFPASKRLRYWMPFQPVDRTISFLKRLARDEPVAVTFADDGEKFGLWPKTYEWVYEQGWLEQFFSAVERERSWLKTATFSEYLKGVTPNGRVYLPCGSYDEMLEWSGGYFRNFFVKYPEANAMYHRMLQVSKLVNAGARDGGWGKRGRGKRPLTPHLSPLLRKAQRELYKGQCNCAYWHGVFGGLYLSHLRRAVYHHLLTAEQLADRLNGGTPVQILRDVDGDGRDEIVLRSEQLGVVVDPSENGTISEVDDHRHAVNLLDTMARHREPYHQKLQTKTSALVMAVHQPASIHDLLEAKEEGLHAHLIYDDHRRSSFVDYALSSMPTLQQIIRNTWTEHRLWPGGSYQARMSRSSSRRQVTVQLVRHVARGTLRKTVTLMRTEPRLRFRYEVEQLDIPIVGLEMNLGLWEAQWDEPRWDEQVGQLDLRDGSLPIRLTMRINPPASVARFPIYTVSESEGGMERTAQGLAVVCLWPLNGRRRWSCDIDWIVIPA